MSGGINLVWIEMRHSSGVGGLEVQATRWVHWGVERRERDKEEVMDGWVHGGG